MKSAVFSEFVCEDVSCSLHSLRPICNLETCYTKQDLVSSWSSSWSPVLNTVDIIWL